MKLNQYLFENDMTQTEFAKKIGYSFVSINRICKGKIPGWGLCNAIYNFTDGKVSYFKRRGLTCLNPLPAALKESFEKELICID